MDDINFHISFSIYLKMQCQFSYEICQRIWPDCSDHYWKKWITANNNIINFIDRLDEQNKLLMFEWGRLLQ
jgi:hypothetical protein